MNMKHLRFFVSILVLTIFCLPAGAQLVRFNIGIEGGGLGTYMQTDPKITPGLNYGGYGGANVEIRIGRVVGFFGEAIYSYETGNQILETVESSDGGVFVNLTRQYIHIPAGIQLWMGRAALFHAGFQQSIMMSSTYTEDPDYSYTTLISNDAGAMKYYVSVMAGFKFNFGRVVYLNIKGSYGLSPAYVVRDSGAPVISASVGLGFRLYSYRKSAFK